MRHSNRDLTEFLRSCRASLRPADVGLPGTKRGGSLTQDHVAELIGVSRQWYLKFEAGDVPEPTLSLIRRTAEALRLGPADVETFLRLATRDALPWVPRRDPRIDGNALASARALREFARRSSSASDLGELATLAAQAVARAIAPTSFYVGLVEARFATFIAASGNGEALVGLRSSDEDPYAGRLARGETVCCSSVARSGHETIVALGRLTGMRSFAATTLEDRGAVAALIGVTFEEERDYSEFEIAALDAVRAVAELAIRGNA